MLNLYNILLKEERKLLKENLAKEMHYARKELRSHGIPDNEAKELVEKWETKPCFRKSNGKYLKGFARLYCNNEISSNDGDRTTAMVEKVIDIINRKYNDKFNRNLESVVDGHKWSANELIYKFGEEIEQERNAAVENGQNKGITTNSEYKFVRIPNFSDAEKYGKYTSWCVTHAASNYNSYTNDGTGIFIFCLKNGFESIPRERTEGNPMDKYGVSMIAISVNADGDLNTCTCRWNHDCGAGDQMMTREQIEEFFHVNFAETFYPRTEDEEFEQSLSDEELQELVYDDSEYLSDDFSLMQSVDDVSYNGQLKPDTEACYGLYYEGNCISDHEYHKGDCIEVARSYVILKGVGGEPFRDLYLANDSKLKNIYTYESVYYDSYIVGSYFNNNKYYFFCANLEDEDIWDGEDTYQRKVEVINGTKFEFLEKMSEDFSSGVETSLYYLIDGIQEGTYTIVNAADNRIICQNERLKIPEDIEDISELMPYYDEENEEYYLETIDGHRIDVYYGQVTTMDYDGYEVYPLKDCGIYKTYYFKPRNQWLRSDEIYGDIWYDGKWIFQSLGIKVRAVDLNSRVKPMFDHYILYQSRSDGYYEKGERFIIDLNTLKQVLVPLIGCCYSNESGWGYGTSYSTPRRHYIFDKECKLMFPVIMSYMSFINQTYSIVQFEDKPLEGYVMKWKKVMNDNPEPPIMLNQDRPFEVSKGKIKINQDNKGCTGFDLNGVPIQYIVGNETVQELQTEQFKIDFHNTLNKLWKIK